MHSFIIVDVLDWYTIYKFDNDAIVYIVDTFDWYIINYNLHIINLFHTWLI